MYSSHAEEISKKIYESQHILNYLFLVDKVDEKNLSDYKEKSKLNMKQLMDDIFEDIDNKLCEAGYWPYNFFMCVTKELEPPRSVSDISFLDMEGEFWDFIFKQEAIISSYSKIRKMIAECYPKTTHSFNMYRCPYYETQETTPKPQPFGLLYLTKESKNFFHDKETSKFIRTYPKGYLSEEDANKAATSGDIKLSFPDEYDINNDADDIFFDDRKALEKNIYSAGGNTSRQTPDAYNDLSDLVNFNALNSLTGADATADSLHQLNTLELYNYIIGYHAQPKNNEEDQGFYANLNHIAHLHKQSKQLNYETHYRYYEFVTSELPLENVYPKSTSKYKNKKHFENADILHCRNQHEQITSISAADCLFQNIDKSKYKEYLTDRIGTLSLCFNLPNSFSRQYIIQMAFDCLKRDLYKNIVFDENPQNVRAYKLEGKRCIDEREKVDEWISRYKNMMNLLHTLYFPAYDNYFFATLWSCFNKKYSDPLDCMTAIYEELSSFLNDSNTLNSILSISTVYDKKDGSNSMEEFVAENLIQPFNYPFPIKKDASGKTKKGKPRFDFTLYNKCIESAKYSSNKNSNPPDILNLEYLKKLDKFILKEIRAKLRNAARTFI